MSYIRFGLMIATSTIIMFILMYLNTYAWEHLFFSETRAYMAILMGATMAIVMLSFMVAMYSSKALNIAIFLGAAVVFAGSLWLVRSQVTVSGPSYMRAMIPHHSIAVMTSERAGIEDARVRKLADEIIAAQRKEIGEMRHLIADIEENGIATDPALGESEAPAETGTIEEALGSAQLAGLDVAGLKPEEIETALGNNATCEFRRTNEGEPVLAMAGEVRLAQVLVNLITNASDAMAGQARRELTLTLSDRPRPTIRVADTGTGIAQPERIFDPFYSTKEVGAAKGMGLGLSISYGMVQSFGGEIRGANRAEGGAEFTIELPPVPGAMVAE